MSEHAERFIAYLKGLKENEDRAALAALRHSLAFPVGAYPKAYPYVERFAGGARHERDAYRLALYAVAGLFARHPAQAPQSFAAAWGGLLRADPQRAGIESRFIALLGADAENIVDYLRQAFSLLAAADSGLDYVRLLRDLSEWLDPRIDPSHLRQRWAREFYRAAAPEKKSTDAA